MQFYLRNNKGQNIAEVMLFTIDNGKKVQLNISSSINVLAYSEFLLGYQAFAGRVIVKFTEISELRGWLWETYFAKVENDVAFKDDVVAILTILFKQIANEFDLKFVTG